MKFLWRDGVWPRGQVIRFLVEVRITIEIHEIFKGHIYCVRSVLFAGGSMSRCAVQALQVSYDIS